ncbi:MAG: hypothetical protein KY460_14005 [Actinobacteria bacterium]|nr:hypothetical protein [Actinomycetota bacterium]
MLTLLSALLLLLPAAAGAHPDLTGDPDHDDDPAHQLDLSDRDPVDELVAQDHESAEIISDGPTGKKIKNMVVTGHGERLVEQATTDVWALGNYAYIGTFNDPCGTGENYVEGVGEVEFVDGVEEPGIVIFDVRNKNKPEYVGNLPSVEGSRTNDVKVFTASDGTDILVHSNEACEGGKGGFEIYDVSDPLNPVHLTSVQVGDVNLTVRELFGTTDVGVHNLFLFSQDGSDYVAAVVESVFDNFQVFDITDPTSPQLVAAWGAEELFDPGVGDSDDVGRILDAVFDWLAAGFGASQNRFLHDVTISEDGTKAYLSNWDAGLVLLDISDPTTPKVVSVALNPDEGSLDGEVNSHAAWPSEDGSIVVETEEDFSAWEALAPPGNLTFGDDDPDAPLPGVAISTVAGDDFEANQTGNVGTVDADALVVDSGPLGGNTYPAIELAGDQPRFADTGPIEGDIVFIGQACNGDAILNPDEIADGGIAVVRRGGCTFREKNFNAEAAGADAIVIANNITESTPWGGVRIWDYSDPENPVLASTFYTECAAASTPIEGCDPAGTYSVHNVVVESRGNKTFAYISWYWDGMVVLDVTDPYNPVEVARFFDNSEEFIESNGGNPHDFWGVYKVENQPFVYGSDRNGGLYVFKLTGKGSATAPGKSKAPGN